MHDVLPATQPPPLSLRRHIADTVRLAAPLAVAQVAQMAMGVTDTVLLGSLGSGALAAGGLGAGLFFTTVLLLQGVLSAVAVLVAQARGAGRPERAPAVFRTGLLLVALLAVPAFLLLSFAAPILTALGEPSGLARDVGRYEHVLRWGVPGGLIGLGLMRAFLPAIDRPRVILWVTLAAVGVNGLLNYGLIHGAWGLPRLGLIGSATATAATLWGTALSLLAVVHLTPSLRRWAVPSRAPGQRRTPTVLPVLGELLRVGLPVGVTYGVEVTLFQSVGLLAGLIGTAALAAHQIALNVASFAFMVPFAVAQAANVRVGYWTGAGRPAEARRAGFVAIGLGGGFMTLTGVAMLAAPRAIIGLYLDPGDPGNAETIRIAVTLLFVAAVFQIADGVQAVAAGGLRGLRDTRTPMLLAAFGYWGIGFTSGYALAFRFGGGAPGLWWGLAIGLAVVAVLLTLRFHRRTRAVPAGKVPA
ncbi:MAG TPA: MATE family efflux transporter [Stellaceae bacterium]